MIDIDSIITNIIIDATYFNCIRRDNMYNPRLYSGFRLKLISEIDLITYAGVKVTWEMNGAFIESFHFTCTNPPIDKVIIINQ